MNLIQILRIMVNANSNLALVLITVHIAINYKINITRLTHTDNLDIMFLQILSHIQLSRTETEHSNQLSCASIVGPKFPFLHKCNNISVGGKFHIDICDSQIDSCVGKFHIRTTENFLCLSLKIQQHNSRLCISHTVKIRYIIIIQMIFFHFVRNYIFHHNTARGTVHILNYRICLLHQRSFHITPRNLLESRMNIQLIIRIIWRGSFWFKICHKIISFHRVQTTLIEHVYIF